MANLPVYDVGGTQRTTPMRPNQVDGDMFGAMEGRALAQTGQQVQKLGSVMYDIEEKEKQKQDLTKVTEASTAASARVRQTLFGPGGVYEQTGANAEGSEIRTQEALDKIKSDVMGTMTDPAQKESFEKVFANYSDSTLNSVAGYEFKQRAATRTTAKASALQNITDDVIANYNNPEMLTTNFNMARGIIRANADGLPPEALDALERQTVSNMHLAVVQRLAIESPGSALDYYTKHEKEVNGVDHAQAQGMIGQISRIREVRSFVDEATNAGPANDIVQAVIGAESSGNPLTPPSPKGAAGLMQLMPDTAREVAIAIGQPHVARMTDSELVDYFKTPAGQQMNVRMGRNYLGQQINKFSKDGKADIEAALIAYNAGPANAEKWLNSGRDYSVLPKPEETLPYVQKVLGAWRGVDFKGAANSKSIQDNLKGTAKTYFNGDAKTYLKEKLQAQHGPESVDGMSNAMADRLAAMMDAAPPNVKEGLDILSGARSVERQTQLWNQALAKYGSPEAARKWVAPPPGVEGSKGSQHNHGNASDLGWKGGKFSSAPKEVQDWVHANAGAYGLTFPMGHEPWHIETAEARKGGRVRGDDPISNRVAQAHLEGDGVNVTVSGEGGFTGRGTDDGGYISVADNPANAANIYMDSVSPFTVDVKGGSLEAALSAARERFADNPDALAEAERQITNVSKSQETATKAQVEQIKRGLLSGLLQNGQSPREADPKLLSAIGSEGVKQLFSLEDDIKQGQTRRTDPATYIELVNMSPTELRDADLMTYVPNLANEDLKKFATAQAELKKGNSAVLQSSMQSRQQIVNNAADMLGLAPSKDQDDAKTLAQLNRRLDLQVAAYIEKNNVAPDGQELQKMVDGLMIEGQKQGGIPGFRDGTTDRLFQVPVEQMNDFYAASTVKDIPPNVQNHVALTYKAITGVDPDEKSAVTTYNDMVRVQAGGAPVPPADFSAKIRQRFAAQVGRAPTAEETAEVYRKTLIRAAASQNVK